MRSNVTGAVVAGALVPSGIALLGYVAAGSPHVDCDHPEQTDAFYRVAGPFFGVAGLVGAAALVLVARLTRPADGRPLIAETLAVLAAIVALDAMLPGTLNRPAAIVVAVLGLAAIVGAVISGPVTLVVAAYAGTSLVRHRHRGLPDRKERRIYVVLLAWGLIAVLPAVILGVSINADPLCFSF